MTTPKVWSSFETRLQSGYFRLAVLQLLILPSISLNRLSVSDNRNLFHLLACLSSFQCKHHIWSPFKKADISFPAEPAFAVAQADKLLLHLPTTIGADPFTAHQRSSGWVAEASAQDMPYCRSKSRARASPSWVIRIGAFPQSLGTSPAASSRLNALRSWPFQISQSFCAA